MGLVRAVREAESAGHAAQLMLQGIDCTCQQRRELLGPALEQKIAGV